MSGIVGWASVCRGAMAKAGERGLTLIAFLGVFIVYAGSGLQRTFPVVAPDEHGLLFQAQYLAGAAFGLMDRSQYYSFGGALPYVPAAYLISDPEWLYKAVILTNALMSALALPLLIRVAAHFGHRGPHVITLAALTAIWPSYFYVSHYAWSESSFRLTFLAAVVSMIVFFERPRWWRGAIFGAMAAAVYAVHPRGLLVPAVAGLIILVAAVARRIAVPPAVASLAGIALGVAGALASIEHLQAAVWGNAANTSADSLNYALRRADMMTAAAVVAGQAWYQLVASVGLVGLGGVILVTSLPSRPWTSTFIVLSVVSVAAASVAQMLSPVRADHVMYGRYIDGVSILLLWLGLLNIGTKWCRSVALGFCLSTVVLAVAILMWPRFANLAAAHPNNIPGVGWFTGEDRSGAFVLLWCTAGATAISSLLFTVKSSSRRLFFLSILIAITAIKLIEYQGRQSRNIAAGLASSIGVLETFDHLPMHWVRSASNQLYRAHFQFLLGRQIPLFVSADSPVVVVGEVPLGTNYRCAEFLSPGVKVLIETSTPETGGRERVSFLDEHECNPLGWHPVENWGRWSDGRTAKIRVDASGLEQPILNVTTVGLTGISVPEQRVTARVAGLPDVGFRAGGVITVVRIPLLQTTTEVILDLPDAASPRSLGLSRDKRVLALGVSNICVSEAHEPCL